MVRKTIQTLAVFTSLMIMMPMFSLEALAQTGPEADCICEIRCSDTVIYEECPVCKKDTLRCQGEPETITEALQLESETVEESEPAESMDPLTPDGNMELIDDYGPIKKAGKQFITLTSKSGKYFYLIIDRDDRGTETVHFLNLVDERDLLDLMDEEEVKAYTDSLNTTEPESTEETTTEASTETSTEDKEIKTPRKVPVATLAILLIATLAGIASYIYKKLDLKKKKHDVPDPDADYREGTADVERNYLEELAEAENNDLNPSTRATQTELQGTFSNRTSIGSENTEVTQEVTHEG